MKLKRDLGLLHVFCIASGAMISSGIFILPGLAYLKAGLATIICYFLAGLLSIPGMLSLAEMTTAMPFVYDEELEIRIYDAADWTNILQTSVFGDGARNYTALTVPGSYTLPISGRRRNRHSM